MKHIKLTILIATFLSIISCNDNFLELQPSDAISEVSVWQDIDLIELYVNARYNELPHGFPQWAGGLRMTGITDESYHMHEARFLDKYTQGGLTSGSLNMYYFNGFWLDAYIAIRNNNIFLENISSFTEGEEERIKVLTAETRFLRAYFYNELISRYGASRDESGNFLATTLGVPLTKTTFNLNESFDLPRATLEECIAFIVQELDLAIADLPNKAEGTGSGFGRLTKGAAMGLKIRALLFDASPLYNQTLNLSKWQSVADACEELFSLNEYSLSADYKGLFLNPMDSEILFFKQFIGQFGFEDLSADNVEDFYYHYTGGHNINQWRFPNGDGGWISENPRQDFVDQYETLSGQIPVTGYSGSDATNLTQDINSLATDYDPNNPYNNRDPRLGYSVLYDEATFKGRALEFWDGGQDSRDPIIDNSNNGSRLGYGIRKALDETWTQGVSVGSNQPWIYMRLAEFYLTYAEAKYNLGDHGTAETYVDLVRTRVGMPAIASSLTGMDLLDKIKHERKIELAFEGNRWYDARRWQDAETDFAQDIIAVAVNKDNVTDDKTYRYFNFDGQTGSRSFPKNHYFWPIPIEETQKSNITQNPGY
tara:strand:- start:2405 stop:4192 length:1788 start_codon:yes stop_codon:yes gene_type:complete